MRDEFSMPIFETVAGTTYETGDRECAVELEPDPCDAGATWYIDRVFIGVHAKRTTLWVPVPKSDPMFDTIKDWALQEREVSLAEIWHDYLSEVPASKRPPYDENAEHRTHGGSL